MNKWEVRVNGAVIECEGTNEYAALVNLGILEEIEMVETVRLWDAEPGYFGWIYQARLNKKPVILYIKRVG